MKKLLLIGLIISSCATSKKSCEAYGKDNFLVMEYVFQYPIEDFYLKKEITSVYYDTIYKPIMEASK